MKTCLIILKTLVALLILIAPFTSLFSQIHSNWTKLSERGEIQWRDVAVLNSDTIVALDEEGKFFISIDHGKSWKSRNPQTGKELKFNALRLNNVSRTILVVGNDNAVYRSADVGEKWESTYSGSADAAVSFLAITDDGENYNENIIYVVGKHGTILKSVDDGLEWRRIKLKTAPNQDLKSVSFLNADTGYVANENGIIRTFDGGKSWTVVSKDFGSKRIKARAKFKAGKALADVVKSIGNNGGVYSSTDYGETWSKDGFQSPCDLLATGDIVFDNTQCENLQKGRLAYPYTGGGWGNGTGTGGFMLSGKIFKGVLQPRWETVDLENILMVMRTVEDQTVIAEALTDETGRFDLEIPSSYSGKVEIVSRQSWDPDWCPRPLPPDETILEPIEECDESTLQLRVIHPEEADLNDLAFDENSWVAVGNHGTIFRATDPDDDEDGYPTVWIKENSRTNENLLTLSARGVEKSDIRRGFIAAGNTGTIISTQQSGFEILSPAENDSICAGSGVNIQWTGGDQTWNVTLSIIDVNAWTVATVINSNTINDGNETWNIPQNFPPGLYQVYVQEENYLTWAYGEVFNVISCPEPSECSMECDDVLVRNHDFNLDAVFGPMPIGSTGNWVRSWAKTVFINGYHGESPDVGRYDCNSNDTVSIGMWGNKAIGESVEQELDVPFVQGKTYAIAFSARWMPSFNRPYPVQFEFRASTAPLTSPGDGVLIGTSDSLTNPGDWVTLLLPDWIAPVSNSPSGTYPILTISAANSSTALHPDSTSYGQIGVVCITEKMLTNVHSSQSNPQAGFKLGHSYPNPFRQSTVIEYVLPETEHVTMKVFDSFGMEVKTLVDEEALSGNYQIIWKADGLPAGVYFYQMRAGSFTQTKRVVLFE